MALDPKVKTGMTHAGTALAAAYAVFAWTADNKADLYALWDQLNGIIAQITKFVATATPLATAAYGIYRSTLQSRLNEIAADPSVKGVVVAPQVANAVPSDKVQPTIAELPPAAKA